MTFRAILKPEIIAEWQLRRSAFRRQSRPVSYVLVAVFLAALALPLTGLIAPFPYIFAVVLLGVMAGLGFSQGYVTVLKCPNCNRHPFIGRVPLHRVDFCPHCYCWLEDPRTSVGT